MSGAAADADTFDVVVIGGGVNGTGAARDLALRGLSVALLEKTDLGAGATGASSGMIHGGARYLTHEPGVTKVSCTDAGAVRRIAGHMLFRIPFIMPSRRGIKTQGLPPRVATHFVEAFQYAYDLYQPRKGGLPHQRLNRREALAIEPGLSKETVGAVTFDEWGIDAARLCAANALSAAAAGAKVLTHFQALAFERDDSGRVRAVRGRDGLSGRERTLRCRAVLNAAGPWGALVAREAGASLKLRPTKGVHVVLGGRVSNYLIAVFAIDGRAVFLEPWHDVTLVGTTDDDYYGDLDRLEATFDEVQYLLEAVGRFFPSVYDHRPIDTWVGVRPTLYQYGPNEDRVSRDHRVYDHRHEGDTSNVTSPARRPRNPCPVRSERWERPRSATGRRTSTCRTSWSPASSSATARAPRRSSRPFETSPPAGRWSAGASRSSPRSSVTPSGTSGHGPWGT